MPKPKTPPEEKFPAVLSIGAGGALQWISEREAQARERVESAQSYYDECIEEERDKKSDLTSQELQANVYSAQKALDYAIGIHEGWAKQLNQFEKTVSPEKRDASESITKEEGARVFKMIAIYIRTAAETSITRAIPEIRECGTNEEAYSKFASSYKETVLESVKTAVAEGHLPAWCMDAIKSII